MKTLYFDCFAGASGNMILGALIGLGVDRIEIERSLHGLNIPSFEVKTKTVDRAGLSATHVDVIVPAEHKHRHLKDILEIIDSSKLPESVQVRARQIFARLAEAEAKVHGISVDRVHFHEVGALDSIVDVIGCCVAFEMLGVERFACSKIHVGSGFVEMEHGKFPVPPPAVAELLKQVPIYSTDISGELITPTGAAIITTVCDTYGEIPELKVEGVAYGAGTRTYPKFPNVLRLLIGETASTDTSDDSLFLLETNLDDVSPQVLGYVMERAFELKALDCWFTPIQMKKNRPATLISILCREENKEAISELLYTETTTLGIRTQQVQRECIEREIQSVATVFGNLDVKIARMRGKVVNAMPEYEHVRRIAKELGVPFRAVSEAAVAAIKSQDNSKAAGN